MVFRRLPLDDVGERGHSARCGQHVAGHLSVAKEDNKDDESQI
jgi:hypothetical protein